MDMARLAIRPQSLVRWYPAAGAHLSEDALLRYAGTSGLVLEGRSGYKSGVRLRQRGYGGPLLLDSVPWKGPREVFDLGVLDFDGMDEYAVAQRVLKAERLVAPTIMVTAQQSIATELEDRVDWLSRSLPHFAGTDTALAVVLGDGALSSSRLPAILREIRSTEELVLISFSSSWDPVGSVGAVEGLATIVDLLPEMALTRTDLAGIGALALGASFAAVGTGTSTRHVSFGGGGGNFEDRSPSVLVPLIWSFKKGSKLARWSATNERAAFVCSLDCCEGKELSRFDTELSLPDAQEHNRVALEWMAKQVVESADPLAELQTQIALAKFEYDNLRDVLPEEVRVPNQVAAWSNWFSQAA